MLELLKIKRDINWLIDQIKCLIRKSDLDSPLSATEWSANHSTITGNPYIVDCFVWFEGKVYKSLINNNIYPPTNATYWANLGLGHLLLEEQTDWNATTGRALLKNKPNLSQYALDSNVVHKTGNETIAGRKTFTDNITLLGDSKIISVASTDNETGFANIGIDETGMPYFQLGTSANENTAVIRADNINTNSTYQLPNSNGTIALDENLVHKTGNEIINGIKDFTDYIIISAIYSNSGQLILASGGTNIIISDDSEQIIANREFIAPSLRIPEGTSTQFLKADGSIDNTIYAQNANVLHITENETKNGTLIVNDTGDGVGVQGNSTSGTGVQGSSQTGLGGSFSTNTGTKIVSFLTNNVEQAYILASGLFKANRILVNTTTDNGIDSLQVNGSIRTTSDIKVNGITIGRGNSNTSVLIGNGALQNNTGGNSNVAIGSQALFTTTNGSSLVAIGQGALFANTVGSANTAIGTESLNANTIGNSNTAIGRESLKANTIGFNNTAVGRSTLLSNNNGNNNVAFGYFALLNNILGSGNVAIGSNALVNSTGNNNVAIGFNALQDNTSGGNNIAIGNATTTLGITNTNSIVIGSGVAGLGSNTTSIGNSATATTGFYGSLRLISGMNPAPASATAPGTLGDIRVTAGFIYVCTATNTWVRTALTSW